MPCELTFSLKLICECTSFGGGLHLHRHRSSFRADQAIYFNSRRLLLDLLKSIKTIIF
ncbi:hypothetical protein [Moraxella lacunata]|uniref:hypothetical protein n=1 Tax=Moraxella lacunata TaxID=477 RepID=UPI003EDF86A1